MYPKVVGANATPIAFAEVYLALQKRHGGRAGESPADHLREEVLRGAVAHQPHRPHHRNADHHRERAAMEQALDADKEGLPDVFREACAKATVEIAAAENRLVDEFATSTARPCESDRAAFKQAFAKFLVGPT